jgi:hypothetical protein
LQRKTPKKSKTIEKNEENNTNKFSEKIFNKIGILLSAKKLNDHL